MKHSREDVLEYVVGVLSSLGEEAGADADITEGTYLLGNLNWRSIEVIYLANSMQEHYGRVFPFADFFAQVAQRERRDLSVGEWVDFIHAQLNGSAAPQQQGAVT